MGGTNFIHPELLKGEVFFSNSSEAEFILIPWESKRFGLRAYDGKGNLIKLVNWRPVFVSLKELKEKNKDVTQARSEFEKIR